MAGPRNVNDVFSAPAGGGGGASMLDFRAIWHVLRRFYWIVGITLGLGLLIALVLALKSKASYRSSAEIKVERRVPTPLIGDSAPGNETTPEDMQTIVHSFINPDLMARVSTKLGLQQMDGFLAPGRLASTTTQEEIVGFLMANSGISLVPSTRLLDVSFSYREPEMAQKVANAIIEGGIEYDRDQRVKASDANIDYLKKEADKLEASLRTSERDRNKYTESVGIVSTDQQVDLVTQELNLLNTNYTDAKMNRVKLESDLKEIEVYRGNVEKLGAIDSVRNIPIVLSLTQKVTELKGNIAKLSNRYRAANTFMVQATTELREVERNLAQEILNASASIEATLSAARRNEEGLARAVADQEQKVLKVRELSIQTRVFDRQIEANRMAYEGALQRLNQEISQARSMPVLLQVVEPAGPAQRIAANKMRMLLLGVCGGLAVGFGIIVLISQLDRSIKSSAEAEKILGLEILATVPALALPELSGGGDLSVHTGAFPVLNDSTSSTAESFRVLRAAIQTVQQRAPATILIAGCSPGAGASFCALNLAGAFAQSAQRTLLVDANLRNPVLEEWIFMSQGRYGLSDFVLNDVALPSVIHQTTIPNLDVVTAGGSFSNVGEILARKRFQEFCDAVRPLYDRIIFDSTALSQVSDTVSLARHCESVCLIVAIGQTKRENALYAVDLLDRAGIEPAGLIVNFSPNSPKSLLAVLQMSPTEAVAMKTSEEYPVSCPACGFIYQSLEDFIEKTTPPTLGGNARSAETYGPGKRVFRVCSCGTLLVLPPVRGRDNSESGILRRELFAELLGHIVTAGIDLKEARAKLLLALKIWRVELNGAGLDESSEVAVQRRQLFEEIKELTIRSGLTPAAAEAKLLETIKAWQNAP